jgi:hypothetical protein
MTVVNGLNGEPPPSPFINILAARHARRNNMQLAGIPPPLDTRATLQPAI